MAVYNIPGQQTTIGTSRLTVLEYGAGVFSPISTQRSFARVTLISGGDSGGAGASPSPLVGQYSGKGGNSATYWLKLNMNQYTYVVGAGGASPGTPNGGNLAGGTTVFGTLAVNPGYYISHSTWSQVNPTQSPSTSYSNNRLDLTSTQPSAPDYLTQVPDLRYFYSRVQPLTYGIGSAGSTSLFSPSGTHSFASTLDGNSQVFPPDLATGMIPGTSYQTYGGHSMYGYGGVNDGVRLIPPQGYGGGGAAGYLAPGGVTQLHYGQAGGPGAIIIEETLV